MRSVAATGDGRRHGRVIALRIVNEVKGVSRAVHDISGKPPAMIGWE